LLLAARFDLQVMCQGKCICLPKIGWIWMLRDCGLRVQSVKYVDLKEQI
jgi:hypothetical protein